MTRRLGSIWGKHTGLALCAALLIATPVAAGEAETKAPASPAPVRMNPEKLAGLDLPVEAPFLPPEAVQRLLPDLLQKLRPGARIVTHEQLPLVTGMNPGQSKPLFAANAMTVGHLWTVG